MIAYIFDRKQQAFVRTPEQDPFRARNPSNRLSHRLEMIFCPLCHNLLLVQKSVSEMLFICYACPYFCPVTDTIKKKTAFNNPLEDEIFGESTTDTIEGRIGVTFSELFEVRP